MKVLKILLGIAAGIAAIVGIALYATSGIVAATDEFFAAVQRQDFAAAHGYLSEDFKATTNVAALQEFISSSALVRFKEASWSSREIRGSRGALAGAITTQTGGVVPLKVSLVKENSLWRIDSLQKPAAGLPPGATPSGVPSEAGRLLLAKRTMHDFGVSMNAQSMRHFHSNVSRLWQRETTPEKLDAAFGFMFNKDVDWLVLDRLEPGLKPVTALGEHGELILVGSYRTKPRPLLFKQKYIYEGIDWRLYGLEVELE